MTNAVGAELAKRRLRVLALFAAAAGLIIMSFWALAVLPARIYPPLTDSQLESLQLTDKERLDVQTARLTLQGNLRATAVQILAGAAVLSGAWLAWRQHAHLVRVSQRQGEEKREEQHLALFAEALASLGSDASDIRIGGIHALSSLATMSPAHRPACADVLSAFVRNRSPWPPSPPHPDPVKVLGMNGPSLRNWAPDVQVAIQQLGMHTHRWHGVDYLRFRGIDLRKANLADGHFEGAAFTESFLTGAYANRANFNGASLRDADLSYAKIRNATFDNANLRGTSLLGSDLVGATFHGATFDESTRWPDGFAADDALARGAIIVPVQSDPTTAVPVGVVVE